jgi:predicted GH43/DUF377 family glycosyl hydrolase
MGWAARGEVLPSSGPHAELDRQRAFRPSVLEDDDGTLRMWYSGHDGTTGRILSAVHQPGQEWARLGVCVEAGFGGESDAYGVESPCVVRTPGGYLMAYAGSSGEDTQLHMAASVDGHNWRALGTFLQRGEPDAVGATHPCLVVTADRWWLFYAGYDGTGNGRRAAILAAVSPNGASWDRVGSILEPEPRELAVYEPWIVVAQHHFYMFFVSDDGKKTTIEMATSLDGVSWQRQGTTLSGPDIRACGVRSPCALRLHDGTLRLWYAALRAPSGEDDYRLWLADFVGQGL